MDAIIIFNSYLLFIIFFYPIIEWFPTIDFFFRTCTRQENRKKYWLCTKVYNIIRKLFNYYRRHSSSGIKEDRRFNNTRTWTTITIAKISVITWLSSISSSISTHCSWYCHIRTGYWTIGTRRTCSWGTYCTIIWTIITWFTRLNNIVSTESNFTCIGTCISIVCITIITWLSSIYFSISTSCSYDSLHITWSRTIGTWSWSRITYISVCITVVTWFSLLNYIVSTEGDLTQIITSIRIDPITIITCFVRINDSISTFWSNNFSTLTFRITIRTPTTIGSWTHYSIRWSSITCFVILYGTVATILIHILNKSISAVLSSNS